MFDLGSGTGRVSGLLADSLNAFVIVVEPSDKMRDNAKRDRIIENVGFINGFAENIPLEDSSCDYIWLSMTIHHILKIKHAINEMNHIFRPHGKIFIRNSYKNSLQSTPFYKFFPTALAIDNERLPSVEYIKKTFTQNGFYCEHFEAIQQVTDYIFNDYVNRISKRGLSIFELISDEEFNSGIQLMEKKARRVDQSQAVVENIDFIVFSRLNSEESKYGYE